MGPSVGDAMARVLIVEDETPIRELLNDFLSDEGFETSLAEDGRHGIELARADKPDVILMDLMLPLLDGIAAVRALKDRPETRDIPIVVMSANSGVVAAHRRATVGGRDDPQAVRPGRRAASRPVANRVARDPKPTPPARRAGRGV